MQNLGGKQSVLWGIGKLSIRMAVFTHARFPLPVVSEGDSEQHKELLLGRYNVT